MKQSSSLVKKNVWILLDNRFGSVGILRGVAQALDGKDFEVVEKQIEYNKLSGLPNCLKCSSLIGTTSETKKEISAPWPDMVITASRRTASISRYIKKKSNGKTKLVHLTHPGNSDLEHFDIVFLPEHDNYKKTTDNCFFTVGSPHRITKERLEEASRDWCGEFKSLPKPLTALMIGGSIKGSEFSDDNLQKLTEKVKRFKETTGGSLLISTSKRTGSDKEEKIKEAFADIPKHTYFWGAEGLNPYVGYLACADNIIITGDSVSMVCEACGTGKPVFIFSGTKWLTIKHYHFINNLFEKKYAAELSTNNAKFKPEESLNDADVVVEKIKTLFEI